MSTYKQKKPLWMTGKVLRSVKKSINFGRNGGSTMMMNRRGSIKNRLTKQIRLAKRNFERKIAKNIKADSKSFFTYVRSKTRVQSTVGPLMDENGVLVSDSQEMGNMSNTFFASVFTQENQDARCYWPCARTVRRHKYWLCTVRTHTAC